MKNVFLFTIALLSLLTGRCRSAVVWSDDYDPTYKPVKEVSLVRAVENNYGDAAALVKNIEQARAMRMGGVTFQALDKNRRTHPRSPDTLAAFCWAYKQDIDTAFVKDGDYRERTAQEEKMFNKTLEEASKIAPQHWLVNLVKGYVAYSRNADDFNRALVLIERAIKFCPPNDKYIRSYCCIIRGGALNGAAMRKANFEGKRVTFQQAANALEQAAAIDPRQTTSWLTLFAIYRYDLKDQRKALRAKAGFLKAFPRDRPLPRIAKRYFANYP